MIETPHLKQELNNFIEFVIEESKANLESEGINASGSLRDSLMGQVEVFPNSFHASIDAEDYWKFIDRGVAGVESGTSLAGYSYTRKEAGTLKGMPPPSAFDKWNIIRARDSRDEKGRFLPRKRLNFATAVGVFLRGIKPTSFLTTPFEAAFESLPDELIEAYDLDVTEFLNLVLKESLDGDKN